MAIQKGKHELLLLREHPSFLWACVLVNKHVDRISVIVLKVFF